MRSAVEILVPPLVYLLLIASFPSDVCLVSETETPPMRREPLECHVRFNPSRQSIASSSTRTASMTGTTGRASNTKAGRVEQNL